MIEPMVMLMAIETTISSSVEVVRSRVRRADQEEDGTAMRRPIR